MGVHTDMLGHLGKMLWAIALLTSLVQTSGATEWGPSVNGLRMAAAIVRNDFGNYELEATIENTTSKEILIVLGHVAFRFAEVVHVIVKSPHGSETAAFYLDSGGGLARRLMPMVLPLLPKSSYSIRTLLAGWGYYSPTLLRLEELLSQKSSLRMELINTGEERVRFGVSVDCYGSRPFWNGRLVSNILHFPLTNFPKPTRIVTKGSTVNDLCMSVAIASDVTGNPELDICIQNTGLREYMLPFGRFGFGYPAAVRFYVRTPNEASKAAVRLRADGAGAKIPNIALAVPMLPRSDYRMRVPLKTLRLPAPDPRSLPELLQPLSLHLEFSVSPDELNRLRADCYSLPPPPPWPQGRERRQAPAGYSPAWQGTLVSNVLTFQSSNSSRGKSGKIKKSNQ
jgi:hypothetical protein